MSPQRWQQVNELFAAAAALDGPARTDYLARACAGDAVLRAEVERLLQNDSKAGEFLHVPTGGGTAQPGTGQSQPASAGDRVGAYRLVRQIATGGMGSVWLAERADDQFHSRVAVKFIHAVAHSDELIRRFRQERQLLANLRHPNICRLLDGGITEDGRPYLIMEYIDGLPIHHYCDGRRLSIADRLGLFRTVCSAVQFAHQNLVVHRDLKPANILVKDSGEVTLLDFGIAKVLGEGESTGQREVTAASQRLMTPAYASPEQIKGEPITTASDVYALGVILYELLTGRKPYRPANDTLTEFERAVCEQEPSVPSATIEPALVNGPDAAGIDQIAACRASDPGSLRRTLSGDLDTICLMALRKEPQRRYATVEQFSEDVRKYVDGLPVLARPDTLRYRSVKFVRRNRLPVVFAASIFILLSALTIITRIQSARIAEKSRLADERYREMQKVAEFQSSMLSGINAEQMGHSITSELRQQVKAGLERIWIKGADGKMRSRTTDEVDSALRQFENALAPGNATDVARQMMDANILKPALAAVEREFASEPEVEARLRGTIGEIYSSMGMYDAAEAQLQESLAVQRRLYGDRSLEVAATLNRLGVLLMEKRDFAAAEPALRDAFATRKSLLPAEHLDMAQSLNNIGLLLIHKGDLQTAEIMIKDGLAIRRRLQGNENSDVAQGLQNLTGLYLSRKDYAAAEPVCRESLAINRKVNGGNSWPVAASLNNLAGLLAERGDLAAAAPYAKEAMDLRAKTLGNDHPTTLAAMGNVAGIFGRLGRFDEAEPLARRAVAGWESRLPPGNANLAISRLSLVDILSAMHRCEEALAQLSKEDWDTLLSTPNVSPMHKQRITNRLSIIYETCGDQARAAHWRAKKELAAATPPAGRTGAGH